jgi:hypothetical protein
MTESLLAGRCMAPKNPKPSITTYFCVYPKAHGGTHSWEDSPEKRQIRMKTEGWA